MRLFRIGFVFHHPAAAGDVYKRQAQYSAHLRDIIKKGVNAADYDHPLKGFKIIVDAGNGAGGFYAVSYTHLSPAGAFATICSQGPAKSAGHPGRGRSK